MANHRRGEISVEIDGASYNLCLTLGALAEIESHFGVADLPSLGARLAQGKLGAQDVIAIISAAARGAGREVTASEIRQWSAASALPALLSAILELFARTFPAEAGEAENPPVPQQAR